MGSVQHFDMLTVIRYKSRHELGREVAKAIVKKINQKLEEKDEVNMLFAAAPSQNELLEALVNNQDIEWSRINAFHLDEYIGLTNTAPQRFSNFLNKAIFDRVPFKTINYINASNENPERECERYGELLKKHPIDVACIGIGENGHMAFNDPHSADFHDEKNVKIVSLDEISRIQQVHDGCFDSLDEVPKLAITVTIPVIMSSDYIACVVPGEAKAEAVKNTLFQRVDERFPSTIMRKHKDATLYLDSESAKLIDNS